MKRISIIISMLCMIVSANALTENETKVQQNVAPNYSQSQDWRVGDYRRRVKENFISFDIEAIPVIAPAFNQTTPWAGGLLFGYEHKTRPSSISSRFSIGYGAHVGIERYFGEDIKISAVGNPNAIVRDKYKSFTEIPVLLDFNWYYNFSHSNLSLNLSAGVNLLLGQRDATLPEFDEEYGGKPVVDALLDLNYIASVQNDAKNDVVLSHVIPTFRAGLTYTQEISQDWRLRIRGGVEYQMNYQDEYSGYFLNTDYIPAYHKAQSPAALNPYIAVGVVYSL